MKLYQGSRSSASWRVRWALALKHIPFESVWLNIAAGEHLQALRSVNPLCTVPTLELDDGRVLFESVAILEWLDEVYPTPRLLPQDGWLRARVRELVQLVNADIHPLQNTKVRLAISSDEELQNTWARRWIERGLSAYEQRCAELAGRFSVGDELTMADLFLLPQYVNGRRFGADLTGLPRIERICAACIATPEAAETHPDGTSAT